MFEYTRQQNSLRVTEKQQQHGLALYEKAWQFNTELVAI